ncbi:MAG: hypothetical protein WCA37_16265 [Terracidiphilus sp.]
MPAIQELSPATSATSGTKSRWIRLFNRVFSRHLMSLSLLATVVVILSGTLVVPKDLLHDPDLWWHLADAKILFTTHHFIRVEPYSFTVAGQRWVNPEWLAEVPYWLGYRHFGLVGIYLVTFLGLYANVVLMYWRSHWRSGHAGAAFWATGIGFFLVTVNAGAREIVIAYILLSLEMAILEAADRGNLRWLWFLPPLFCVWVNTHGSWLIGLGIFVLFILCGLVPNHAGVFDQDAFTPEARKKMLLVLAASVAALLVNPYGWRLVWNPFDMMANQKLNIHNVQEWQPLNLEWLSAKVAVGCIAFMVITNGIRSRKWKLFDIALVLFAWYAAFDHSRFLFMAAVLITPMMAMDFERVVFLESDEKTIPFMNMVMVVGSIALLIHFFPGREKFEKGLAEAFPLQTIASIQPSWRTMNNDGLGGMMDMQGKPTFIDSRFDTFEHHGVFKDFLDISFVRDSLHLLDKYQIDHVLINKKTPLAYLLEHQPGWTVLRTEGKGDSTFELFGRTPIGSSSAGTCSPAVAQTQPHAPTAVDSATH